MKLKKIEISGFKSFQGKVVLDFSQGISAVVGPNGCGKSNIVDAIRWVMGEQRVKMLRGKKMDDVIFNGSADASPVGMAEVVMTLGQGLQPFPGEYGDCHEIAVSRRLFRDGESEYAINKTPCRLLDVREFFLGTGIGTRAYSLVEQNSVAGLVEAKPEERREFIEEAAGVSKYKSRKEAAVRKMEATQLNLTRVGDIIKEVKGQLSAISRQARRAEQYKALRKSVKEAETILALQAYTDLAERHTLLVQSLEATANRDLQSRTALKGREAAWEERKRQILDGENALSEAQRRVYQIRNEIGIKEQAIAFTRKKVEELTARKGRNLAEIEALGAKRDESEKEIETLTKAMDLLENQIREVSRSAGELETAIEALREGDREMHRRLEARKSAYLDTVTQKTTLKNTLFSLTKNLEDLKKRGERDARETEEHHRRLAASRLSLHTLQAALAADQESGDALKARQEDMADELSRLREDRQETDEEITALKEEIGAKSSRLQSLEEFHQRYEWCSEGTRVIMSLRNQEAPHTLPQGAFLGLVADHLDVPRGYETAVEAALGEKLQYVLVKSHRDGIEAIDYLKQSAQGRCSFVPMEVRRPFLERETPEHLREAVPLMKVVGVREDLKDILRSLLGDVLLIPNLANGISLWRQNGFRGTFVTPEGDLISPQGILTGGRSNGGEQSLLRNKREMAELQEALETLTASLAENVQRKKSTAARIAQWEEEIVQLRSEGQHLDLQMNGRRKDLERCEDDLRRLEQRIAVLDLEREEGHAQEEETALRIARTRDDLQASEEQEGQISGVMAALQGEWEVLRTRLQQQDTELTRQKVLLASLQEKRTAHGTTVERLQAALVQTARDILSRQKDTADMDLQAATLQGQSEQDSESLKGLYGDHEALEGDLNQSRGVQQESEAVLRSLEEEMRQIKRTIEEITDEKNKAEMACREVTIQMDNLREGLQAKDYADIEPLLTDFQGQDEEALEALRTRLARDRQTLDHFGEVNLLAVSEYEQLNERHTFLTTQAADLNESLTGLQKTIARINAESRKRFAETFAAINACFKDVFTKLFPGGRGELRLTDETDLLETGVDIDIQIPGKRPQNISLLSGGEKSLAAIALIFAIILHRPSPFIILDEADAALDDTNISLFNRLVKDSSAHSQVIIVTHNKKTMEIADNLYGVTMQQHGVSTVVSVNLN